MLCLFFSIYLFSCMLFLCFFVWILCLFFLYKVNQKIGSLMSTIVLWNIITQLWTITLLMSLRHIKQWLYIDLSSLIPCCIHFFSLQRSSTWQGRIKFGMKTLVGKNTLHLLSKRLMDDLFSLKGFLANYK